MAVKFEVERYVNYRGDPKVGVRFIGRKERKLARRYDLILSAEEALELRNMLAPCEDEL